MSDYYATIADYRAALKLQESQRSIDRVRAAARTRCFLCVDYQRGQCEFCAALNRGSRIGEVVDQQVDWITRIAIHVQDGHRDYASWCSRCRTRRLLAFVEITLIAASLGLLALLNWWPQ